MRKVALIVLLLLYLATRITTLKTHELSYTYDQGRDFLQAAQMIDQRNLVFIGPTTGIIGLYHGAWWYYVLAVPYLLFRGLPVGFYYFNLLIHLISFAVLLIFTYLEFGWLLALFAGLLVMSAPYFISTSLFVGNNIMAIPSLLAFLISLYYLIKKPQLNPQRWLILVNGVALGLVAEFELSFGLFLIPVYFSAILVFRNLRNVFFNLKLLISFAFGLGLIFLPRLLFEIKNGFSQTKILLGFFFKPQLHNPKPYAAIFYDRWGLFRDYYTGLFANNTIMIVASLLIIYSLVLIVMKKKKNHPVLNILLFMLLGLFMASTLYKDNFWHNYYEGIHYLLLLIIILVFFVNLKSKLIKLGLFLLSAVLLFNIFGNLLRLRGRPIRVGGLLAHEQVVSYIYRQEPQTDFCVDIYTPPAIPNTYRYLFYYQHRFFDQKLPIDTWQRDRCWYILEADDFVQRRSDWIKSRIPRDARLIKHKQIADIQIQLWQK